MTNKSKWITVLSCFVLLLLAAAVGAWNAEGREPKAIETLERARLVGMTGRMPDNSAKIFFESMIGRKLASYKGCDSVDECLYRLYSGEADAMWVPDVSAYYLADRDHDLEIMDTSDMAAIENTKEPRFTFGMAAKNDADGRELVDRINYALDFLEGDGILGELKSKYIDNALEAEPYNVKNMVVNDSVHKLYYYSSDPIVVGITGAVPPIELIDVNGRPTGFCVALMDEIGQVLQCGVEFVLLDNETAFSSLMSGRVDIIFCYGSGRITTEGTKDWCMTRGYCDMQRYEFLYRY